MASSLTRHNGSAIRDYRVLRGIKPGDFAKRVGISYPHLDNIENERKEASVEVIHRMAAVLGVEPTSLVRDPASLLRSTAHASQVAS